MSSTPNPSSLAANSARLPRPHRLAALLALLAWSCLPPADSIGADPAPAPAADSPGAPPAEIVNYRAARALIEKMQQDLADLENRAVQAYAGKSCYDRWGNPLVMAEADIRANFLAPPKQALADLLTRLVAAKDRYDKKILPLDPDATPEDRKLHSGEMLAFLTYDAVRAAAAAWWEAQVRFAGIHEPDKCAGFLGVTDFLFQKRYDDMDRQWFQMEQPRYSLTSQKDVDTFDAKQKALMLPQEVDFCDQQADNFRNTRDWLKAQRKWIITNLWHWQALCDKTVPDREADSFKNHIRATYDNLANTRKNGLDPGHSVVCQEELGTSVRYSPQSWHIDFGPDNPFLNGWSDVRAADSLGVNNNVRFTIADAFALPAMNYNHPDSDVYDPVTMSPAAGAEEVCKTLDDRLRRLASLSLDSKTNEKNLDDCLSRLDHLSRLQSATQSLVDQCHAFLNFVESKYDDAAGNSLAKAKAALNDAQQKYNQACADLASRKSDLLVVSASPKDTPKVYFGQDIKDPKVKASAVSITSKVADYRKFAANNSQYQDVAGNYNNSAQAISDLADKALQPYNDAVQTALNNLHQAGAALDQLNTKYNSPNSAQDRQKALSLWNDFSSATQEFYSGPNSLDLQACGFSQDLQPLGNRPQPASGDDLISGPKVSDYVSYAARTARQLDLLNNQIQSQFGAQRSRLGDLEAARESHARAIIQCFYDVMNLRIIALDRAEEMANKSPEADARTQLLGDISLAKTQLNNFLKPPRFSPTGYNPSDKETLGVMGLGKAFPQMQKIPLTEDAFKKTGAIAKFLNRTESFDKFQKQWNANDPDAFATAFGLTTDILPAVPVVGPLITQALGYYGSGFTSCVTASKALQDRILLSDTTNGIEGTNNSPELKFYKQPMVRELLIHQNPSDSFIDNVTASFQIRRLMYLAGQSQPSAAN